MSDPLYFEQIDVGDCWKSPGRTVTETDVVGFAGLTGDYNPLHVDEEHARRTPFGQRIAHGLLGMSLVAGLGSHSPPVHTIAFVTVRDWRFLKPIYIGDTVHVFTELVEKHPSGRRRGVAVWNRQLINQHGDVVQEGQFETLVASADTAAARAGSNGHPGSNGRPRSHAGNGRPAGVESRC